MGDVNNLNNENGNVNINANRYFSEEKPTRSENYTKMVSQAANLLTLLGSIYIDKACGHGKEVAEDFIDAHDFITAKNKKDSPSLASQNDKIHKETKFQELSKDPQFIGEVLTILNEHKYLLIYAHSRSKKELLHNLEDSYDRFFKSKMTEKENINEQDIDPLETHFKEQYKNLLNLLNDKNDHKNNLLAIHDHEEREMLCELLNKILRKFNLLLSGKAAQENLDKLQAMAIAFNSSLPFDEQMKLVGELLLIKELWQPMLQINISNHVNPAYYISSSSDHFIEILKFKISLNKEPKETLKYLHYQNAKELFHQLLELLINKYHILEFLTSNEIIAIYDRLKNKDFEQSWMVDFLLKLHEEAQLRYGSNRLSDSGYELLKRFQSYDTIVHQIDLSEFTLAEAFLLRRPKLLHEIMLVIGKHTDNIKALGMVNSNDITNILQKIKIYLEHNIHKNINNNTDFSLLLSVKGKLFEKLEPHISKRYAEFDKFTMVALKIRYVKLLNRIKSFLKCDEEQTNDTFFIQDIVINKLAQDYCTMHHHNSLQKLRAADKERQVLLEQLNEINFVKIFDQENLNYITSLNFRKQFAGHEPKTSLNYVSSIIYSVVSLCSASQLEKLYKSLQKKPLSEVQLIIKQEIINQITKRTTISKLIYSLMSGSKKEFDKLKSLKKHINSPSESVPQL